MACIEDFNRIKSSVIRSCTTEDHVTKKKHIEKLNKLKAKVTSKVPLQPIKAVVNLSNRQLTTAEETILNKGLNFATSTKRINNMDIVASIEETSSRIGREQGDELRWKVRQALEKAKSPKANTTKE